ncbi:hypothetical protein DIY08_02215 [Shewanella xiamenensis]|nr:hypothetical protein DIY08_02215 [Shewanella xiamenensis]
MIYKEHKCKFTVLLDSQFIYSIKQPKGDKMKGIRIQGLKSLADTDYIPIKPLTVLLGENSSGKSTFLRTFPLFRQSLSSITRGPILWFGSFVDFGSYENALSKYSTDNSISFGFKTKISLSTDTQPYYYVRMFEGLEGNYEIQFTIEGDSQNKNAEITKIRVIYSDITCNINFSKTSKLESLMVNEYDFTNIFENCFIQRDNGKSALLPIINFKVNEKNYHQYYRYRIPANFINDDVINKLTNEVKKYCHIRSNPEEITHRVINIENLDNNFFNHLKKASNTSTWKKKIAQIKDCNNKLNDIKLLIFAYKIPSLLYILNEKIASYFSSVKYIAPLRATAERYYRTQDLSVEEVDYQGKNLAMFLNNLSEGQKRKYKDWLLENFGFQLDALSDSGHLSLKLRYKDSNNYYNVTDMGFGFSQILPIITQLWFSTFEKPKNNDRHITFKDSNIIVIEQPELHLHPRFQSRLVDVFVKAIMLSEKNKSHLQLIIETHSETIVNQIGHRIYQKKLSAKDVSIVIFEKKSSDLPASVTLANFDDEGNLESWPWGFFEAELD